MTETNKQERQQLSSSSATNIGTTSAIVSGVKKRSPLGNRVGRRDCSGFLQRNFSPEEAKRALEGIRARFGVHSIPAGQESEIDFDMVERKESGICG
jgi:hypothetical protein